MYAIFGLRIKINWRRYNSIMLKKVQYTTCEIWSSDGAVPGGSFDKKKLSSALTYTTESTDMIIILIS